MLFNTIWCDKCRLNNHLNHLLTCKPVLHLVAKVVKWKISGTMDILSGLYMFSSYFLNPHLNEWFLNERPLTSYICNVIGKYIPESNCTLNSPSDGILWHSNMSNWKATQICNFKIQETFEIDLEAQRNTYLQYLKIFFLGNYVAMITQFYTL